MWFKQLLLQTAECCIVCLNCWCYCCWLCFETIQFLHAECPLHVRGRGGVMCIDTHLLISAPYKWFVCLLNFLPYFLPSLLSSFLILSFLLIYFLSHLLPDLSIYFFQNRPSTQSISSWMYRLLVVLYKRLNRDSFDFC